MPTSGDLKPTPHPRMSTQLPSCFPNQLTQPEWEWLRTLYEVLHKLHIIKIRDHGFNAEILWGEALVACVQTSPISFVVRRQKRWVTTLKMAVYVDKEERKNLDK